MGSTPGQVASNAGRARSRRRISPLTIAVFVVVALCALGAMFSVLLGVYPPKSGQGATIQVTPTSASAVGLKVEKAGAPRVEGDRVIVPLKVTNKVEVSAPTSGTPTPGAATPTAGPAKVLNGAIKVFFYTMNGNNQVIVGSGIGNVTDLGYGETKQIEVTATDVGKYTDYVAFADTIWTDKDPVKGPGSSGGQGSTPGAATATP